MKKVKLRLSLAALSGELELINLDELVSIKEGTDYGGIRLGEGYLAMHNL